MTLEVVTLRLPRTLLSDAQRLARARDVTVGEMIRKYLEHETTRPPETPVAKTLRLIGPIFETAQNWEELNHLLHQAGYTLKPQGTGVAVYDARTDKFLCNASKTGFKYRKLVKRYRAVMPGHPHGARHLPKGPAQAVSFEVIE